MSRLTMVHEAMSRLDAAGADANGSDELSREQLIAVNASIGMLQRRLDAVHVEVAACISRESRPELGAESLAKQQGFRNPATLLAATVGVSRGDATRLVRVGEGVSPRMDLGGSPLPARYPVVREALAGGALSAQAAAVIIALLEQCRVPAGVARVAEAESLLVESLLAEKAVGLALDDVRRLDGAYSGVARPEPGGVTPR